MGTLKKLVAAANKGDKKSLEMVILEIKDLIYNLSLKMQFFPDDAKDATQEILILVITHLSTFRYESKFTTWVYRIAINYLITHKGKQSKQFAMPFEDYAQLIDSGHSDTVSYANNEGELALLEEEVKISCTQGLLLCLNEMDRMVYILSTILEFNSTEGANLLNISADNYRKKLSRSRKKIQNFLQSKCGIFNPNNPCRCKKKIDFLINQRLFDPKNVRFAYWTDRSIDVVNKLSDLERDIAIYRSVPEAEVSINLMDRLKEAVEIE